MKKIASRLLMMIAGMFSQADVHAATAINSTDTYDLNVPCATFYPL